MSEVDTIAALARSLVNELTMAHRMLATAESCTGGWIAKALTDIGGSSRCFGYGIVSYSDDAKKSMLGVNPETLRKHGAVSESVVREMALGVLAKSGADFAVAVSGVAGPGGGTDSKPVGTVWFAWAIRTGGDTSAHGKMEHLQGDREAIRSRTVVLALRGLRERLKQGG
jgi:nicotinamide-nucleotide amidase